MIRLEPFTMGDAAELMDWIPSGEFLMQWGGPGFIYPLTFEQIEGYVHAADQRVFKAVEEKDGTAAGHICLSGIDLKNESCRISKVMVNPALRGKGYGSALVSEVLKFAFLELNMHRVSLGVFVFNEEAIACYRKAGFQQEGHIRDCRKMKDSFWSIYEMGILRKEWEEVRAVQSHQIISG
ncbi:GNAT family N-acetyltransferase [Bacillus mangrovi]|uniref:GNAT family N-acetyltransferase n=1 Tax=Metabacillus mangrovi TaxID=1491830 RepID=A0A7X2S3K9_9BACI|nr:GNAT family protein [Metabacillus mangrovi]MTH53064.1 GNAT family N-acetyltransferase [Metabacillus mangrovi]